MDILINSCNLNTLGSNASSQILVTLGGKLVTLTPSNPLIHMRKSHFINKEKGRASTKFSGELAAL